MMRGNIFQFISEPNMQTGKAKSNALHANSGLGNGILKVRFYLDGNKLRQVISSPADDLPSSLMNEMFTHNAVSAMCICMET